MTIENLQQIRDLCFLNGLLAMIPLAAIGAVMVVREAIKAGRELRAMKKDRP